ncbi:MAG: sigma-70 family RNA polymerase sigma factor [Firmicutes bacterium]|nr:sigma-70 family RNA polymerase sigma factor [Bacillota bacterium]MDD4263955.1 sigma-70 family RNA polymerase sigma factor [Bacillota bacterium]MDD4693627.1 sigma-70 family RNA polymerase sigma factor [Bacillota bacterium]
MQDQLNLLSQAKAGNKEARDLFLEKNTALVIHIAKRFSSRDNEDLIQAGFIGLIKALDNFDPSYGTAFSTYAVPLIMGEIKEWLRKEKQISLGRKARDLYLKYRQISEKLYQEEGVEPSLAKVAEILDVDSEELIYALEVARTPKSLDEPIDDENKLLFGDLVVKTEDNNDTKILIDEMLNNLDDRSRYIVVQRFFAEKTQVELAAELNLSQAQICRIEKKALHILRDYLGDD